MINKKFEAYKIQREITRSGQQFTFQRYGKNKFGEPDTSTITSAGVLFGLYHEENSYVTIKVGETTQIRKQKQPRILCLFEDVSDVGLQLGDWIILNGKQYKYNACTNIQEWNIIADISLEEMVTDVTAN